LNLQDWAESVFGTGGGVVEQDGATTYRIKLVTPLSGDTWHTWFRGEAGWPEPDQWETSAQSVLRGLEQNHAGRVAVNFVAETKQGEMLSQLPWKLVGKMSSGNLESVNQAASATFASLAGTIERIQELANRQLDNARNQVELNLQTVHQQSELLALYRQKDLLAPAAEGGASPVSALEELAVKYMPQIIALGQLWLQAAAAKAAQKGGADERQRPTVGPRAKQAQAAKRKTRSKAPAEKASKPAKPPKPTKPKRLGAKKPSRRTIVKR
jgi:hypothetical protein